MSKPRPYAASLSATLLFALAALGAASLRGATLFATPPDPNGDISAIAVSTSGLNGACPGNVGTVTLTFTAGANAQFNNQQISIYGEILTSADDGACDGFTTTCDTDGGDPDPAWWVIESNTSAQYSLDGGAAGGGLAVDPGTDNCSEDGSSTWPNNGGWDQPLAAKLTATGQTFTVTFEVEVPAGTLPGTTYYLELGANYGNYQDPTGASEGYVCLPITTGTGCPSPTPTPSSTASPTASASPTATPSFTASPTFTPSPSATPSFTASPTFSDSPTATPSSTASPTFTPSPSATPTATPSPTQTTFAGPATPSATSTPIGAPPTALPNTQGCGLTLRPNYIFGNGTINIVAQPCSAGGVANLRIVRPNGRVLMDVQRYLAPQGRIDVGWDGLMDDGRPAPSGIYYVVLTEDNGRPTVQKVLVVR